MSDIGAIHVENSPPLLSLVSPTIRTLLPADLPRFRALHDETLEVQYDAEFYHSIASGMEPNGTALFSLVAVDIDGEMLGALSARLFIPQLHSSTEEWMLGRFFLRVSRAASYLINNIKWACGGARSVSGSKQAPSPAPPDFSAYVMTLCVGVGSRRRGVARALIQALIDHLASLQYKFIELHMLVGNTAAENLYSSMGFIPGRTLKDYYHFNGAYHDAVLWEKTLVLDNKKAPLVESARDNAV